MTADLRVMILSDAEPERNGVGSYYQDLAGHLRGSGHAVEFLAPGRGDPPLPHWLTVPLPGDRTQRLGVPSPRELRRRVARWQPDVVIVAAPGPYGLMGARYARAVGARLVFGLHTDYEALSSLYWGAVLSRINRWPLAASNRLLLRAADSVVAISPHMQQLAASAGRTDVFMLSTHVPQAFVDVPTTALSRSLSSVVYVGRLAAEKRIPRVIEAAERLPHIRFRIAGDGPLRKTVEAAAIRLPNLDYLGWLTRDEVRAAVDRSDLLLLPSAVEAFGTVALEALARERLVLASAGCGIHGWPDLAAGLCCFDEDEHPAAAIARLAALDTEARRVTARQGRAAAKAMHARAITEWMRVLRGDGSDEAPVAAMA